MGKNSLKFRAVMGIGFMAMGAAFAQTVPNAPDAPTCTMKDGKSDCRFKPALTGNPTSVSGNRVILFRYSKSGGHGTSRTYLDNAVKRLAATYNFTATITEDPSIFTAANLANTKVVIMSNGDGDVLAAGANRTALENFNQVNGWGVIWIHAACAFITNGWPFGQQSCVQQYHHHNPSGTQRRFFVDSGTTASPNHGIKNPQSEFLLRSLPGFAANRTFATGDEYYCFQAPARNTANVNVLLGYDRSSGLPDGQCPNPTDASVTGSQNHNLAWAHMMGKGVSIYNSLGHDEDIYTGSSNSGDSLLWREIRYAAKDWEVSTPTSFHAQPQKELLEASVKAGSLSITFTDAGFNAVTVSDLSGRKVFSNNYNGQQGVEIPNLQRGLYFVKVASSKSSSVRKVRIL